MGKIYTYVPGAEFPYQYKYEHMAVTTDCVIFTYEDWKLKVLLVRRGGEPCKGQWAFPGGFLKMDETAEQGALRELQEETGLQPAAIGQLGVFSDVHRDPRERVITIAWYALVKPSEVVGGDDTAMEQLRRDIHFQPVGFDLLDDEFTIPDLQRLYEAILGVKFDRRNFQRKLLSAGILEEADSREECYECAAFPDELHMDAMSALPLPGALAKTADFGESRVRKGRQGRPGLLFRLNRKKYAAMKEDGGKMEF